MCSSLIDVAVRGEREEKFESEPGARSYEPNEVEATRRNLSHQKLLRVKSCYLAVIRFGTADAIYEFEVMPLGKRKDTMKFNLPITTTAALAFVLAGAASSAQQEVRTNYDRSATFERYKTYTWQKISTPDPLVVDRIKSAVNSALAAKGWAEAPSGGDAAIVALVTTQTQETLRTFYDGFGGGWRWRGGFGESTTTPETYTVGTLVVDIFDANSKKLIWRGAVSGTRSNNSDTNIKELYKVVNKMFNHFPPRPDKD
jgi:hypothetical protein